MNIAATIMESNSAKFKESATEPMRSMMSDLQDDIRRLQYQSAQSTAIMQGLDKHASRLGSILSNSRMRGAFGEMAIEKWFDTAGLKKGVHYGTQVHMPDGSKPDFVVYMPDSKCIILDSKVPLDKLAGAFDDGVDSTRQAEMFREHRKAVQGHITKLGSHRYTAQDIPPAAMTGGDVVQPVEYAVMVVPEYALGPVMDAEMIGFAQERGIILATPSMTVLVANVVHMMWRQRDMSQNVRRVIAKASALQRAIDDFSTRYDRIGTTVKTLNNRYDEGEKMLGGAVVPLSADLAAASSVAAGELEGGAEDGADTTMNAPEGSRQRPPEKKRGSKNMNK